jgi:hypothetical protein
VLKGKQEKQITAEVVDVGVGDFGAVVRIGKDAGFLR